MFRRVPLYDRISVLESCFHKFESFSKISRNVPKVPKNFFTKLTQNWNFIIQYDPPDQHLLKNFDLWSKKSEFMIWPIHKIGLGTKSPRWIFFILAFFESPTLCSFELFLIEKNVEQWAMCQWIPHGLRFPKWVKPKKSV